MPTRKDISSDDGDSEEDIDGSPPNKKVKTSVSQKGRGAHSATLASATRPRTASAKQVALSNILLILICILGANWRSQMMNGQPRKPPRFKI
jgi:hypothetical protein